MGPEGIILVNSPISTFQQSLTHSAMGCQMCILLSENTSFSTPILNIIIKKLKSRHPFSLSVIGLMSLVSEELTVLV